MAITSGFFDSVNGDRVYNADQMTNYFEGLVSDGIYQTIGDAFVIRATGEGLNVTVGSGRALCKTHWIKNDAPVTFTLSPANVQFARRDSVFIRYNSEARTVSIVIAEGVPGQNAPIPQPVRTETTWDLFVGYILIDKNISLLTQTMITDNRGSNQCPWVTGLIKQVDTSQLFLQFQNAYEEQFEEFDEYISNKETEINEFFSQKQAEFDSWFEDLTEELRVDTTLKEYKNTYAITQAQEINRLYPLGISNYSPNDDILFVIVDGIVLTENVDFKILKFSEHYPDIDNDGYITAADVSAILAAYTNISAGNPSGLTPTQEKAADANLNGMIDADDASIVSDFYTAVGTGVYPDASFNSWKIFLEDNFHMTLNSDYFIVPISTVYRQGSQMTFRVIKSIIG